MSWIEWENLHFPLPDHFLHMLKNWENTTALTFDDVFGFQSIFGLFDTVMTPPELLEIGSPGCDGAKDGIIYLDESDNQREWVTHCNGDGQYSEVDKVAEDLYSGLGYQAGFMIEFNQSEEENLDHIPEIERICQIYNIPIPDEEENDETKDDRKLKPINQRVRPDWLHVIAYYDNIGVFAHRKYFHPDYSEAPEIGDNHRLLEIGHKLVNVYPASAVLYLKGVRVNWSSDDVYYEDANLLLRQAYLNMNKKVLADRLTLFHPEIFK